MNKMRKCVSLLAVCALLLLTAALSGCEQTDVPDDIVEVGAHYCGPYELMMNGRIYKFMDIGRYESVNDGDRVIYVNSPNDAYLPEGYTEYGPAVPVEHRPEKDGEVVGTGEGIIYTNPATPEAVYVYAQVYSNAYHTSSPHYVRFISEKLYEGHDLIRWNGVDYRMGAEEVLDTLPDSCTELGALTFISWDALPTEDLQTNCTAYEGGRLMDGCTAYADPNDPAHLYVQVTLWRDGGEQQAYHVCRIAEKE